jgi:hypothetical protein
MGMSVSARLAAAITIAAALIFFQPELWISFVLATLGLLLLTLALVTVFRRQPDDSGDLSLFPSGSPAHVPARRNLRSIDWFTSLSRIGFLYSQMLILLVIPGILVFHYAWGYGRHYYGLYVLTNISLGMKAKTCGESWVVRVDAKQHWYLNSKRTSPEQLPRVLHQQLGKEVNCVVYVDVDPELPYYAAIQAIDIIDGTQAKAVVLLTPHTKASSTR